MIDRRSVLFGGLALTATAAHAANAPDWDAVVKAATAEGEVLLYSTKDDSDNATLLAGFMKKYPGLRAKSVRLVSGAMVARVDQELKAGALAADVLINSEQQWFTPLAAEQRFVVPNGPSVALWKGAEHFYASGVVQVTAEPWVIGFNTDLVKTVPTDWDSLLGDGSFQGQIGLDEITGMTVAIWYDFIEKKKPGYFETLAKLSPRLYPNASPLTGALASGELAWAPYSLASAIELTKASGAPIDWRLPASGTWSLERNALVFKEAPHPNAAKVLLDYLMSAEGQQVLSAHHSGYSVVPGLKLNGVIDVDVSKIEHPLYASYGPGDLKAWQAKVDQLFRH
jgi:iron(III) transport system substrate-binding protein